MQLRRTALTAVLLSLAVVAQPVTNTSANWHQSTTPNVELPFPAGARWVVIPPARGRSPGRTNAWAIHFAPVVRGDETVLAPGTGRVRLIDMRPPMVPIWCEHGTTWTGPQREVQVTLGDGWTVVVGYLDHLAVADGDTVVRGQALGTLSASDCGGARALALTLWQTVANGVHAQPFGTISSYRDDELYAGVQVLGSLVRS